MNSGYSQTQRDIPIPVIIILLEHIRHPLQRDTRLHEKIETYGVSPLPVVRAVQQLHKLWRQAVSKRDEGVGEFVIGYRS